ncbi:MAG: ferritin-like domain-containing protein, partial [Xanthomonadales bacterium]
MAAGWFEAARRCLELAEPAAKCAAVREVDAAFRAGDLERDDTVPVLPIGEPGRPERPELVDPSRVPRRRLGGAEGRAALVHAIAHIEFNAINLALDAVYRFRGMPRAYYADWLSVAVDEARHFELLTGRLAALDCAYGDLPAHDGLWEMARKTADSC